MLRDLFDGKGLIMKFNCVRGLEGMEFRELGLTGLGAGAYLSVS